MRDRQQVTSPSTVASTPTHRHTHSHSLSLALSVYLRARALTYTNEDSAARACIPSLFLSLAFTHTHKHTHRHTHTHTHTQTHPRSISLPLSLPECEGLDIDERRQRRAGVHSHPEHPMEVLPSSLKGWSAGLDVYDLRCRRVQGSGFPVKGRRDTGKLGRASLPRTPDESTAPRSGCMV